MKNRKVHKKTKTIYGVGINDADYPVTTVVNKHQVWCCPFYETWRGMLRRCYSPKYHEKQPTYIGCLVTEEWCRFSVFKKWMEQQDWYGKELDKDILTKGNKTYSPSTCVFVTKTVNMFLTDHAAARGEQPIGVHWNKRNLKYQAYCSNPFTKKVEHLGYFDCKEQAYQAWKRKKHEHACTLADMQTDERVIKALRERYL